MSIEQNTQPPVDWKRARSRAMERAQIIDLVEKDVIYLDDQLLDGDRRIRPATAAFAQSFPLAHLRAWAGIRGRYQIVTAELLLWLRDRIGGRTALEVAAGFGDLGSHLGVVMTDSGIQCRPEVRRYYASLGQAAIDPPSDVICRDAVTAVDQNRPQVVVASWLTQSFAPGDAEAGIGSSVFGADEGLIIGKCDTYIHIGNANVHGDKRALALPHETHSFPWLVSRAADQAKNVIYVWERR